MLQRPQFWVLPPPDPAAAARLPEKSATLAARLRAIAGQYPQAVFASSLAAEDMIITAHIATARLPLRIITLDTGKLHDETVALIQEAEDRYGIRIERFYPDPDAAAAMVAEHGEGLMYKSVALRKFCCHIRKIEPLNRALAHAPAWLTGQRRSQSVTRHDLPCEEFDSARHIAKFNPLYDWEDDDVWTYVQTHDIPLNPLYNKGYPSIGCEPCTVPVKAGDDIRSGRWAWESRDSKECGLHK